MIYYLEVIKEGLQVEDKRYLIINYKIGDILKMKFGTDIYKNEVYLEIGNILIHNPIFITNEIGRVQLSTIFSLKYVWDVTKKVEREHKLITLGIL